MKSSTFSIGFRFYYWDYYQNRDALSANEQITGPLANHDNTHDHSGYRVRDMFVQQKHNNFKEEIASYPHFNIGQYDEAVTKTNKFMSTKQIKKYKCRAAGQSGLFASGSLYYGIEVGAALLFYHILALILYTDYSALCTAFSATFRSLRPFETLKSIKQRNACYYWMSRYLRELVECFGRCSNGDTFDKRDDGYDDYNKPLDAMKGPFYCGMNFKLNVPSFAMRLNSPTSTSKQIAVASKFSGTKGVVFTFDNPRNNSQYEYLRGWDCSWISRFREEEERLFFGGYYRIKVVNLRLIESSQNFKGFVQGIFYFDSLLTASYMRMKPKKTDILVVLTLVNHIMKKKVKRALPPFILDCFQAFVQNKKQIVFSLLSCGASDKRITDLFVHSFESVMPQWNIDLPAREDGDFCNVMRSELFSVFPNVKSLIIRTSGGPFCCTLSMIAFLSEISSTDLEEIVVQSTENYSDNAPWVKQLWQREEKRLKKEYAAKGFEIVMVESEKVKPWDKLTCAFKIHKK